VEKLAALVPPPRFNLAHDHGVQNAKESPKGSASGITERRFRRSVALVPWDELSYFGLSALIKNKEARGPFHE
jgi:hypothetical protein